MRNRALSWRTGLPGLALLIGTCYGCDGTHRTAPVEGIVRLDGEPLATGTIRFTPAAGRAANGQIQSDGTFRLSTFSQSDGALVGLHRVSISAFEGDPNVVNYDVDRPRANSLVPLYYASPESSDLTFEVEPGIKNRAEFDLKSDERSN